MSFDPRRRLIVALDFDRLRPARELVRRLAGRVFLYKVGSQLFTSEGPGVLQKIAAPGSGIFLDLKFHDIPSTVAGATRAAASFPGVRMLNVHALGGYAMMRAAAQAVSESRHRPKLLGVTLLTSLDRAGMRELGITGPPAARAVRLAKLARRAGLDGVVASPWEAAAIRRGCGPGFLVVTPGVRPAGAGPDDQARTATPGEAIRNGADYLVIGRPITAAADPLAAVETILKEMARAFRARLRM